MPCDGALDPARRKQGVHDGSTVISRQQALESDASDCRIDAHHGQLGASGDRLAGRVEDGGLLQARLAADRLRKGRLRSAGYLRPGDTPTGWSTHVGASVGERDVVGCRFQQVGRDHASLSAYASGRLV
ncbi:MAG: hypothetical protein M3069_12630 [Chloroflexota bacterium]|nr:hypothetical protein [Chloroflexota bacterium]